MVITTMLAYLVARGAWGVRRAVAGSIALFFFLVIEFAFFGANLMKVAHGGWFPLVIGAVVYTVLSTWKRGRALLAERMRERLYPFDRFLQDIEAYPAAARDGHRDLHDEQPAGHAADAAAQPAAQQGAARTSDPADRCDQRRPVRVAGQSERRSNRWATASTV